MTIQLLVYLVTTILTYAMGIISKKLKWNATLPIPIQNIIIGAVVTAIGCLIHIDGLNTNEIIQAVITAMGGIGTATVVYDAKNK